MSNFGGIENIAPAIIKYPIEKVIKAIINLKLGRKRTGSVATLTAFCAGIFIGYSFPVVGQIMLFLISLVVQIPISAALLSTITTSASMLLSSVVLIYVAKKSMNYYNKKKYGVSNSEHRLTENDKEFICLKYEYLSKEELDELITNIRKKIIIVRREIYKCKLSNQPLLALKYKDILRFLKRGELDLINDEDFQVLLKKSTDKELTAVDIKTYDSVLSPEVLKSITTFYNSKKSLELSQKSTSSSNLSLKGACSSGTDISFDDSDDSDDLDSASVLVSNYK